MNKKIMIVYLFCILKKNFGMQADDTIPLYDTHTLGDLPFVVFAPSVHVRNQNDIYSTYPYPTAIGLYKLNLGDKRCKAISSLVNSNRYDEKAKNTSVVLSKYFSDELQKELSIGHVILTYNNIDNKRLNGPSWGLAAAIAASLTFPHVGRQENVYKEYPIIFATGALEENYSGNILPVGGLFYKIRAVRELFTLPDIQKFIHLQNDYGINFAFPKSMEFEVNKIFDILFSSKIDLKAKFKNHFINNLSELKAIEFSSFLKSRKNFLELSDLIVAHSWNYCTDLGYHKNEYLNHVEEECNDEITFIKEFFKQIYQDQAAGDMKVSEVISIVWDVLESLILKKQKLSLKEAIISKVVEDAIKTIFDFYVLHNSYYASFIECIFNYCISLNRDTVPYVSSEVLKIMKKLIDKYIEEAGSRHALMQKSINEKKTSESKLKSDCGVNYYDILSSSLRICSDCLKNVDENNNSEIYSSLLNIKQALEKYFLLYFEKITESIELLKKTTDGKDLYKFEDEFYNSRIVKNENRELYKKNALIRKEDCLESTIFLELYKKLFDDLYDKASGEYKNLDHDLKTNLFDVSINNNKEAFLRFFTNDDRLLFMLIKHLSDKCHLFISSGHFLHYQFIQKIVLDEYFPRLAQPKKLFWIHFFAYLFHSWYENNDKKFAETKNKLLTKFLNCIIKDDNVYNTTYFIYLLGQNFEISNIHANYFVSGSNYFTNFVLFYRLSEEDVSKSYYPVLYEIVRSMPYEFQLDYLQTQCSNIDTLVYWLSRLRIELMFSKSQYYENIIMSNIMKYIKDLHKKHITILNSQFFNLCNSLVRIIIADSVFYRQELEKEGCKMSLIENFSEYENVISEYCLEYKLYPEDSDKKKLIAHNLFVIKEILKTHINKNNKEDSKEKFERINKVLDNINTVLGNIGQIKE